MLMIEARTSQQFVRHYFSDIEGPRPLFAINTTMSCFLLAGGAMLLLFCVAPGRPGLGRRTRAFLWSQAAMLAFLAFDDRFQLHEALAYRIGIGDHFIMAGWAVLEAVLILSLARRADIPVRSALLVAGGCLFFGIMMVFDAIIPHDMIMRLSIEDLAKSWAAALFFAASWCLARYQLGLDPGTATLKDWPVLSSLRRASEN